MIPLKQIQVPEPCGEDWDAMDGDARRRFCAGCGCHVHDLSAMTGAEAQRLLDRADGRLCVRFQTRPDGTPLTQEGASTRAVRGRWPRRFTAAASRTLALLVAGLGLTAAWGADRAPHKAPHAVSKAPPVTPAGKRLHALMGKVAFPRPVAMRTMGIIFIPHAPPPPPQTTMGAPLMPPPVPPEK